MNKLSTNNLFDIQVFVLLYESLNATAVSQALGVPTSKVSRSLKSLRHSLNASLFVRKQQGFERSQLADDIYPKMKRIVELAKRCEQADLGYQSARKRELVIACPSSLSLNLLHALQQKACAQQQDFLFHLTACSSNTVDLLKQQHVDIAVTCCPYNTEQISSELITKSDSYVLMARTEHPLFTGNRAIDIDAICDYPYISFSSNELHDAIDPLASYALDTQRKLDMVLKVCFLADLMLELEQTNAVALLNHSDAIEFLCRRGDIKAVALDNDFSSQISQRSGQNHYYLTQMRNDRNYPQWVSEEIQKYIQANVIVKSGGAS
ncbi:MULTISPECIES: LysR family transcriptional regulator [Shewanella]|uniref:LysR family transcriptional regulator n=1 Tax=Shewanella fidelis TaxID=173509 RepID=A0AAW8NI25_9GAMM|nr:MULTISPECIES: LysR family transcriptional regulator [Shewanella]MDR8522342.1 LysR family transcriptional regulator [Shewanella fidelis]MDW4812442.1 LysR family transcriptional regulator [Shewanella fidelis]MDW4816189.1 LysR family transcriptional regulator [Shewanella fidelis]MDW4820683.1 LysR family transcriptional regulator [Shewanella fidelis]MDW4824905.1 LysR family transcriptional regulator [Shewanella fidelis]